MPAVASPLVLASGSPRRAALLRSVGVALRIAPVDCDETPHPDEAAVPYARRIADAKLHAALARESSWGGNLGARWGGILVADTVVWRDDGVPLGKPTSRAHAAAMLTALTEGPPHHVTTAWALARGGGAVHAEHETTRVVMRPLIPGELEAYLQTDQWCDKAGGYGIQGHAGGFVSRIEGSYSNVVGLPLSQVLVALREASRP